MTIPNQDTSAPNLVRNYDYADFFDPVSGSGYNAPKGSLYRYIPQDGSTPTLWLKTGSSNTAWTQVSTGAPPPSGIEFIYTVAQGGAQFTSIQAAINQAVADGVGVGGILGVINVAPGEYVEDLTLQPGISIIGSNQQISLAQVKIGGHHTFVPPAIPDVLAACVYLVGLTFADTSTFDTINVDATNPCSLFITNCTFSKIGAGGHMLNFYGAGGGSICTISGAIVLYSASPDTAFVSNAFSFSVVNSSFQSFASSAFVDYTGTQNCQMYGNQVVSNFAYVVSLAGGNCISYNNQFNNFAANSNGWQVAAGTNLRDTNSVYNIPAGTGFVYQGAGTVDGTLLAYLQSSSKDPGLTFNLIPSDPPPAAPGRVITTPSIVTTGDTTAGNADITVASALGLSIGMWVSDSAGALDKNNNGYPDKSYYKIVNIVGLTITLNYTASATVLGDTFTFFEQDFLELNWGVAGNNVKFGVTDAFGRPSLQYNVPQGIFKMGLAQVDGDPQNIPTQGFVCYGNPLDGSPMSAVKWTLGYYQNQYMLLQDDAAGVWYQVDTAGILMLSPAGVQVLKFDRSNGSEVAGLAINTAVITAPGTGAKAFGNANGAGSQVNSTGYGSLAHGLSVAAGVLTASGVGTSACGTAAEGIIESIGEGTRAAGHVDNGGTIIRADGSGSIAQGYAAGGGLGIYANGNGAIASGTAAGGATISAIAAGTLAIGANNGLGPDELKASGLGSCAMGYLIGGGAIIRASGQGSMARGVTTGSIIASGNASFAQGSGNVTAAGDGSFAHGNGINLTGVYSTAFGNAHTISAELASAFGLGHTINGYLQFTAGRYAKNLGTSTNVWIATDPLFVVGNGTGVGTEANAYQLDKDGKITETGALIAPIRVVAVSAVVSSRTDRKLVLNDIAAGVNTLTLPAGEEGLSFRFAPSAANTGTWTLVPNGADTVDFGGPLPPGITDITFTGGVWYAI